MTEDALREEHNDLRKAAREGRRAFARSSDSAFVTGMQETMDEFRHVRAQGVEFEDACRGIEACLRSFWTKPVTKFPALCDVCDDTGWYERMCTHQMRCGRRVCEIQHPAHEHKMVEPCTCAKGDTHRPKLVHQEDELAAVGKVAKKKRSSFGRF